MSESIEIKNGEECETVKERAIWLFTTDLHLSLKEKFELGPLSVTVRKGGIHGILGPVGAGKTTLMRLLAGCIDADGGEICLRDEKVSTRATRIKKKIGYVPETVDLFDDMTASELLNFVGDARRVSSDKRARQIKEALNLVGLDELKNRPCGKLTAEQKKRLSIAAALLGNPDVILIDEPIPAGSSERRAELLGIIRMLGKMKTVVIATSDLKVARELCEDVSILNEGRLLVSDTLENLEERLDSRRSLTLTTKVENAEVLCERIRALSSVISCNVRTSKMGETVLNVEYRSRNDIREAVSALLAEQGAPVLGMSVEALSLDSLYRSLTGTVGGGSNKKYTGGER